MWTGSPFAISGDIGARAVWSGDATHAVSVAGGHHHAMRASASGFCVYNDLAVAIRQLLAAGADPSIRDNKHDGDAIGWAAYFRKPEIVQILQAHAANR